MPYRVVEYDSGPKGMPGMEALLNAWAAEGYSLHQAVRESTYRWVLIFSSTILHLRAGQVNLGSDALSIE
ncbi:hypothetical protein [Sinorhizobium sp. BJ1]|uniref:hypothetical protein n=1 Tax=Sinorhizobium sp. BJ1 TaxID=2035455 RepID=UPI000BE93F7B|nr:hypothetical protein [Sinorhizobium sp. BJ1]PDT82461.1 hypothetical protein CO676_17655 [Sinorhizobium sp. BJ1]